MDTAALKNLIAQPENEYLNFKKSLLKDGLVLANAKVN